MSWYLIDGYVWGWTIAVVCVVSFMLVMWEVTTAYDDYEGEYLDDEDLDYSSRVSEMKVEESLKPLRDGSEQNDLKETSGMMVLWILWLVFMLSMSSAEAQLFRGRSGNGYTTTANGYWYRGKEYVLGRDNPVCSNPNCPMCKALKAAKLKYSDAEVAQRYTSQELIPTPRDRVGSMLTLLEAKPGKLLIDPGCGDGRLLIEGAKRYGLRGTGIEINSKTAQVARAAVQAAGKSVEDKIQIIEGDSRLFSLEKADYVVVYLFPDLLRELEPKFLKMKPGSRVVSYQHPIRGSTKRIVNGHEFYVWEQGVVGELTSFMVSKEGVGN